MKQPTSEKRPETTAVKRSLRERVRVEFAAQLDRQREPDRPPPWFRSYCKRRPLPARITPRRAWELRYRAADRSAALDRWWLFCFMDRYLKVPSGFLQGKRFRLQDWQREFLMASYRPKCRESTLSCARKNGKSGLVAALACYHLSRWGVRRGWRGIAVSIGGPQARQLWTDVHEMAQISGLYDLIDEQSCDPMIRPRKTPPGAFTVPAMDAEFRMMASNKNATGIGASADLVVMDEIGAYPETSLDLIRNLETSVSARGGRTIAISVESLINPFMEDRYDRWKKDRRAYHYAKFAAKEDCDLGDESAWFAANPGLGSIKSLDYMRAEAAKALETPSIQPSFRNFELNQRWEPTDDYLFSTADWKRVCADVLPERRGPMFLGIDLGGTKSFSAAVAYWPESYRLEGLLAAGGVPNVMARGRADAVGNRYQLMEREGSLHVVPGIELVEHDWFLRLVENRLGFPLLALSDEYKRAEFAVALRAAGSPWAVGLRRMGAGPSGGEDIRAFQRAVVRQEVAVQPMLAWTSAIRETVVKLHPTTGWPSIRGRRETARIDLIAAAVLAVGAGQRWLEEQKAIANEPKTQSGIMPW